MVKTFVNYITCDFIFKEIVVGPVEQVEWFSRENAREHRTDRYEITQYLHKNYPVLRRGQPFYFAIKLASRNMDLRNNPVFVTFNFGT
jgi:transglutaminase 1